MKIYTYLIVLIHLLLIILEVLSILKQIGVERSLKIYSVGGGNQGRKNRKVGVRVGSRTQIESETLHAQFYFAGRYAHTAVGCMRGFRQVDMHIQQLVVCEVLGRQTCTHSSWLYARFQAGRYAHTAVSCMRGIRQVVVNTQQLVVCEVLGRQLCTHSSWLYARYQAGRYAHTTNGCMRGIRQVDKHRQQFLCGVLGHCISSNIVAKLCLMIYQRFVKKTKIAGTCFFLFSRY